VHSQLIDYEGHVHLAVRDLIEWVEFGKVPLPSTGYTYNGDSAVALAPNAAERRGIQPVVVAKANGGVVAKVRVGETVDFTADVDMPPGAGRITSLEWDPTGNGSYPLKDDAIDGTTPQVSAVATHIYESPGTYFAAVRVTGYRDGDTDPALFAMRNLGRMRVIVS
jgi:hypothetical protein